MPARISTAAVAVLSSAACTPLLDIEGYEYTHEGAGGAVTASATSSSAMASNSASTAASGGSGGSAGGSGSGGMASADYTQDFEGVGLPTGWASLGPTPWVISTDNVHGGMQAAESGPIGDSQSVALTVTLMFDFAGTISFYHSESTELCCDFLVFSIDMQQYGSWDGQNGWAPQIYNVGPGPHTFTWEYQKDSGAFEGSDHVWIDDVSTQNGYLP